MKDLTQCSVDLWSSLFLQTLYSINASYFCPPAPRVAVKGTQGDFWVLFGLHISGTQFRNFLFLWIHWLMLEFFNIFLLVPDVQFIFLFHLFSQLSIFGITNDLSPNSHSLLSVSPFCYWAHPIRCFISYLVY